MPRASRQQSATNVYHVTMRGIGKRIIFEDDADRDRFLNRLSSYVDGSSLEILAWCLMENHVHLVLKAEFDDLKRIMHGLSTSYANYYNSIHGHVGPVFQGRYDSVPIEGDAQLAACVRYVHLNPAAAKICAPEDYPWSSYLQYLGGEGFCSTQLFSGMFDDVAAIRAFHDTSNGFDEIIDMSSYRRRLTDEEAFATATEIFGEHFVEAIPNMEKPERNDAIRRLYAVGLSGKQIERLTGVGRGIFNRVIGNYRSC